MQRNPNKKKTSTFSSYTFWERHPYSHPILRQMGKGSWDTPGLGFESFYFDCHLLFTVELTYDVTKCEKKTSGGGVFHIHSEWNGLGCSLNQRKWGDEGIHPLIISQFTGTNHTTTSFDEAISGEIFIFILCFWNIIYLSLIALIKKIWSGLFILTWNL